MGFADLFRPKWKHSKATVRAQALRGLATNKHDVLIEVARHDVDDSVRRVAIALLRDPDVLSSIADSDSSDVGVLAAKRATALWAHAAMSAKDADAAERALHHITDGKVLANIVDGARKQSVRQAALLRLTDHKVTNDKALAELARVATDPAIRRQLIEAISDASILRGIAIAGTPRDAAITAIESLSDVDALHAITKKATRKSLRNRAKRRLVLLAPPVPESEPSGPTESQNHYAAQLRLLAVVESAMVGKAYELSAEVADATQSWEALEATDAELSERFAHAILQFATEREAHAENLERVSRQAATRQAAAAQQAHDAAAKLQRQQQAAARKQEIVKRAAEPEPTPEPTQTPQQRQQTEEDNAARLTETCEAMEHAAGDNKLRVAQTLLKRASDLFAERAPLPSDEVRQQLDTRYESARTALHTAVQTLAENEKWRDWANLSKQKTLAQRAQTLLATADDEPQLANKLKELQEEWKSVRSVSAGKGEVHWDRFRRACDALYDKLKDGFAANLVHREALCERAESWKDSTDWRGTAAALRDLQAVWKTLGPVGRADDTRTWDRFRGACDDFFARRDAAKLADASSPEG